MILGHLLVALCIGVTPVENNDADYMRGAAAAIAAANQPVVKVVKPIAAVDPSAPVPTNPIASGVKHDPYIPEVRPDYFNICPNLPSNFTLTPNMVPSITLPNSPKVEQPKVVEKPKMKLEDVQNYTQAVQYADERDGIVFLVATAKWCMPCHRMRAETTESKEVLEYFNKHNIVIIFYLDTDLQGSKELLAQLGNDQDSIPAYCYIKNGKRLGVWGHDYKTKEDFINWSNGTEKKQWASGDCPPDCSCNK